MVFPFNVGMTNFSHVFCFWLDCKRGMDLLKCSAAAMTYSAKLEEKAPLPLVRVTLLGDKCEAVKEDNASTPANKE